MSDAFRPVVSDDLDVLALARAITRIGVAKHGTCTFQWTTGTLREAWELWIEGLFAPVLAPIFVSVHRRAGESKPIEIATLDRELDLAISDSVRQSNLQVGRAFLVGKAGAQAFQTWERFVKFVQEGKALGHGTTLFAMQASLYHLPLATSLAAYAWFELESGLSDAYRDKPGTREEVVDVFSLIQPILKLALQENNNDRPQKGSFLRSI